MNMLADDPRVVAWVEERMGTKFTTPHTSMGFLKPDGTLGSAFVFHNFTSGNIEIMAASVPGGISRQALKAVCAYVYGKLGCKSIIALVEGKNEKARALWERCGLSVKATLEDYFPDGDEVHIMRMMRDECRWI